MVSGPAGASLSLHRLFPTGRDLKLQPVLAVTLTIVLMMARVASAQDLSGRVESTLDALGDVTGTFEHQTVEEVVLPFETDHPSEADLQHTGFEDRIIGIREEDSVQGRLLRATEDSAVVRPDVSIDGQGPLMNDANWAHANADSVAGHYFTSEEGTCETPQIPVNEQVDMFCESQPARIRKTCELTRQIWVDRTDLYRCDRRASTFVRLCDKANAYVCKVNTNKKACIRDNVDIEGAQISWVGNIATISFPAPEHPSGPPPGLGSSGPEFGWAALARHKFRLRISDRAVIQSAILRHVEASGVAQLITPDGEGREVIATYASRVNAEYRSELPQKALAPKTQACHGDPDQALLVPSNTDQFGVPIPMARAVEFERINATGRLRFTDGGATSSSAKPILEGVFDFDHGSFGDLEYRTRQPGNGFRHVVPVEPGEGEFYRMFRNLATRTWSPRDSSWNYSYEDFWNCDDYATLSGSNLTVERDTFRFLDVNPAPPANPAGPRQWEETELELRVVYRTGAQLGGSGALQIEFDGACCDSFDNTGSELCE